MAGRLEPRRFLRPQAEAGRRMWGPDRLPVGDPSCDGSRLQPVRAKSPHTAALPAEVVASAR